MTNSEMIAELAEELVDRDASAAEGRKGLLAGEWDCGWASDDVASVVAEMGLRLVADEDGQWFERVRAAYRVAAEDWTAAHKAPAKTTIEVRCERGGLATWEYPGCSREEATYEGATAAESHTAALDAIEGLRRDAEWADARFRLVTVDDGQTTTESV